MITCTFENGNSAPLRHVCVEGIVVKDDKILLCKRGTYNGKPILESGKWGLVGGFMDRDENLEQALIREAREESGCIIHNLKLFHIKDNPDRPAEDRQNVAMVYIAQTTDDFVKGNEEAQDLAWFSLDQLPPKDELAFDHADSLELYKKYLSQPFLLPFIGKV